MLWPSKDVSTDFVPPERTQARRVFDASSGAARSGPAEVVDAEAPPSRVGPTGPNAEVDAIWADLLGRLQVRCHVGEEYASVDEVDPDGWMSFLTDDREGTRALTSDLFDAQLRVRWKAAPEDEKATCTVERLTFAELVVQVRSADGGVGDGFAVLGCGGGGYTGDDGVASRQVMADLERCAVEVFRLRDGVMEGAVLVLPRLQEHEVFRASVQTHVLPSRYQPDQTAVEALEVGHSAPIPIRPLVTNAEMLARLTEEDSPWDDLYAQALERVTSPEARALVEKSMERQAYTEARNDAMREALEELLEEHPDLAGEPYED